MDYTGTGHTFTEIGTQFVVPPRPLTYTSGHIVFMFPALQNNATGGSTASIAQPVLQLGNNGIFTAGDNWIGALYVCQGPTQMCYTGSDSLIFTPGDAVGGLVYTSNCSGGKCDVNVEMDNNTTLHSITYTLAKAVATNGQTNDTYTQAISAALETYNLNTCDDYPAGPYITHGLVVANELGFITPSFTAGVLPGIVPSCGYNAVASHDRAFLYDSTTTAVQATISGPSSVASGASGTWSAGISAPHTGFPPYSYLWGGVLSGTGSSVTGTPSGSGTLSVTVTDAASVQYTATFSVTVCAPGVLSC
jgi:hypothetical protein